MKKLLILDTSAIMYRSFYALQNLINKKGMPTGAIFGFVKQLNMAIEEVNPDYIAAAYDVKKSTLKRREIFSQYKENRLTMPDELLCQVDIIKDIIGYFGIRSFSEEGYEADDVIASLTEFALKNSIEVHIYTGDKDIQQLVTKDNNVFIHLLGKNEVVSTYEDVKNMLYVYPNQIPDFFGLKGDKSDGIPGVMGIGDVSGKNLIEKYDTLENIYMNIDDIRGKLKEKLIKDKELAFISRDLARVKKDIDFNISVSDLIKEKDDVQKLKEVFTELELNTLLPLIKEEEIKVSYTKTDFNNILELCKNASTLTIYMDENYLSILVDDKVYICKNENEDTLFSTKIDLKKINTNAKIIIFDAKKYMHLGLNLVNYFDILIASYVIDTQDKFEVEFIIEKYANIHTEQFDKKALKNITEEKLEEKSAKVCYGLYKSYATLEKKLKEIDINNTYETIEKPLIPVLYSMEKNGIKIDKGAFEKLNSNFSKILETEKEAIYNLSGEEFNIDSPSQLANILFNKLNIQGVKKTKRGYSTDAEVLEILSKRGIEIADHLIVFRYYKKLLSTYVEPLPLYADSNNLIHSSFNGTGTATGRLSSQNPNLQNIPTRTTEGNMIRNCFIANEGMKLVSFDYSQIELRVLAELSNDQHLVDSYNNDVDLHTHTAKKLFPNCEITKEMRNIGKVINFSVLYGKTPFGLSKELNIPLSDAKQYIETYFKTYDGVTKYLDSIVEFCKKNLYVETLFGTRRYIYDIRSSNAKVFEEAKRKAINTVIQGTAANILKIVMIKLHKLGFRMLLQVHDELIFELPSSEAEKLSLEIKDIMENTIKFTKVKLKTNYSISDKWGELK